MSIQVTHPRHELVTVKELWKRFAKRNEDVWRVELVLGRIVRRRRTGMIESVAFSKIRHALERMFGNRYVILTYGTINLSRISALDSDLSVIKGSLDDDWSDRDTPTSAALVVKIANTSIRTDRGAKLQIYAAAKIADYWIVNLKTRKLEVYRKPKADKSSRTGWSYGTVTMLTEKESLAPLAKPKAAVKVSDLLPRKS